MRISTLHSEFCVAIAFNIALSPTEIVAQIRKVSGEWMLIPLDKVLQCRHIEFAAMF